MFQNPLTGNRRRTDFRGGTNRSLHCIKQKICRYCIQFSIFSVGLCYICEIRVFRHIQIHWKQEPHIRIFFNRQAIHNDQIRSTAAQQFRIQLFDCIRPRKCRFLFHSGPEFHLQFRMFLLIQHGSLRYRSIFGKTVNRKGNRILFRIRLDSPQSSLSGSKRTQIIGILFSLTYRGHPIETGLSMNRSRNRQYIDGSSIPVFINRFRRNTHHRVTECFHRCKHFTIICVPHLFYKFLQPGFRFLFL